MSTLVSQDAAGGRAPTNPAKGLRLLTWNVGSALARRAEILTLLADFQPHFLFLQESRLESATAAAFRFDLLSAGYSLIVGADGLATAIRHGVNGAPIAQERGDAEWRLQRLAAQVGDHRILIRHRHAPSGSVASERKALDHHLLAEDRGLTIDVGDFNEVPPQARWGQARVCFPEELTFRRSAAEQPVTKIDGAIAAPHFGTPVVEALPFQGDAQHRPVLLTFPHAPGFHQNRRWQITSGVDLGPWSCEDKDTFDKALRNEDHALAWATWLRASGAGTSQFRTMPLRGGWSAGARAGELGQLWKRRRRCLAQGRIGDADALLDEITTAIDDANERRLADWRASVQTRSGAAAWIKRSLARCLDTVLPSFALAPFCPNDLANKLAADFTKRWNVGHYKLAGDSIDLTACLASIPLDADPVTHPPPSRPSCAVDTSFFDKLPKLPPLPRWTAEDVLQHLPSGAPGLDGHQCEWLQQLSIDSLVRLASLFDLADKGVMPPEWRVARVTLIPKQGEAVERRPLTILSTLYRAWARRHAAHINHWIAQHRPAGLTGATCDRAACEAIWHTHGLIQQARAGKRSPLYILSMDLAKCYDHLDLGVLDGICSTIGFVGGRAAVANYKRLQRVLFVDGQPSDVVLEGKGIRGIPQGCPIACALCNLYGMAWHDAVSKAVPAAITHTYLDDRLVAADSWDQLASVMVATAAVDRCFGPQLNLKKTVRGVAFPPGAGKPAGCQRRHAASGLSSIKEVTHFRYLGVDIALIPWRSSFPVARARLKDFVVRCDLVRRLPPRQRPAALSDAMAGMWLAGGTALRSSNFDTASSAGFAAIVGQAVGKQHGRTARWSRVITHLVSGPGPHVTLLPAACLLSWARQWARMFHSDRWSEQLLSELWESRDLAVAGPCRQVQDALQWLGAEWRSALEWAFTANGRTITCALDCALPDQETRQRLQTTRERCQHKVVREMLHRVRAFIRHALVAKEAARRPKDFAGLEEGWCEQPVVREHTYAMRLVFGGPALSAAGLWTAKAISVLPHEPSPICRRCGEEEEHTMHRLWLCPCNAPQRRELDARIPGNSFPNGLPPCLARCGLAPASVDSNLGLDAAAVHAIQQYLLEVNALATQALARTKPGKADMELFTLAPAQPREQLFRSSLPPCKRLRTQQRQQLRQHYSDGASANAPSRFPALPAPLPASSWPCISAPTLSFDGSADAGVAGWGVTVAIPGQSATIDLCGPVVGPGTPLFIGATAFTNNTAELSALFVALRWAAAHTADEVHLQYDSTYAVGVATRALSPTTNLSLVLAVRAALAEVRANIVWGKITAHTGDVFNEHADELAKFGSTGTYQGELAPWYHLPAAAAAAAAAGVAAAAAPAPDHR